MFKHCNRLISAPKCLPALELSEGCYRYMFWYCENLISAPELPATTLADNCYDDMFCGCSNLNYIKCLATDISADYCTINWVYEVPMGGTFVKNASMNDWEYGTNGIPSGWTVQNA